MYFTAILFSATVGGSPVKIIGVGFGKWSDDWPFS